MSSLFIKTGYWIPSENEWYKAAYYDPTLNSGNGGYWRYATRSNVAPTPVTANNTGDGSAGNNGNFANFNSTAEWNGQEANVTTVGTNGGSSYYGTYDQGGNVTEWNDSIYLLTGLPSRGLRGGSYSENSSEISSLNSTNSNNFPYTLLPQGSLSAVGFRIATISNPLNLSNFTTIDNINNLNDTNTGLGRVSYQYQIGIYEITNDEYTEFLNAVAKIDTYNLYNTNMGEIYGGIVRSGTSGNFIYSPKTNYGNKPVNYVSWLDCARYCNWLTNGKPNGTQNKNTTESGAYPLYGATNGIILKAAK